MTQDRPTPPPPSRPGRTETWRHERMVQRVPAHLGETTGESVSPWVMVAGIALLILVVCTVVFLLLGGGARIGLGGSAVSTPTRTRTVAPAVTILPVTLPPAPSPSVGPTPVTVKYKIKPGDSLIEIAAKYKVTVQALRIANNLKDDTIRVGDELIIPLPTPTPPPGSNPQLPPLVTPTPLSFQSPPNSAAPAAIPGVIRHIVKRGDTLIGIAAIYGSTVDAIRAANQFDSDLLSIGQEILVPIGPWTPTPTPAPLALTTVTPTAQFAYVEPSLLSPADNKQFRGKQDIPMLSWISPATLKPNEFYVVHLDCDSCPGTRSWTFSIKQGTSKTLDSTFYPGPLSNGAKFSWYVMVVSQAPSRAPNAASPASATWTFVWR